MIFYQLLFVFPADFRRMATINFKITWHPTHPWHNIFTTSKAATERVARVVLRKDITKSYLIKAFLAYSYEACSVHLLL